MNNWDLYKITNYLLNKSEVGNAFTPEQFELMLNHSSLKLFKRRLGMPEEYQLQSAFTQQGYAITTRMLIDLSDFVVSMDGTAFPNLKFVSGRTPVPEFMEYPVGMIYKLPSDSCDVGYEARTVELISEAEYTIRKTSKLKNISFTYPVYRFVGDEIFIHPKEITTVDFSYLKTPKEAKVILTTNSTTGELEYDTLNSVELEWNDLAKIDIISIILASAGLNIRSQEVLQTAELYKTKGL